MMLKTINFFLTLPQLAMWFFLWHTILSAVHVDRLVWFIFWAYTPLSFLSSIISIFIVYADLRKEKAA